MHHMRPKWRAAQSQVLSCSALEDSGVSEIWDAIVDFRQRIEDSGELRGVRQRQAVSWMWSEVEETALDQLRDDAAVSDVVAAAEPQVAEGRLSPATAAQRILDAFRR
jgi:LAO/AO transport system kinase